MYNICCVMILIDLGDKYWYEYRNYIVLKIFLKKEKLCVKLVIFLGVRKMNLIYFNFWKIGIYIWYI